MYKKIATANTAEIQLQLGFLGGLRKQAYFNAFHLSPAVDR